VSVGARAGAAAHTREQKRDADFTLEVRASWAETLRRRGEPYNLLASLFALRPRLCWRIINGAKLGQEELPYRLRKLRQKCVRILPALLGER
jgi:hypothetical protein